MDYNTQREHITLPEYGRIIQSMVDYAVSIPTKESRQAYAAKIIDAMSRVYPNTNNVSDYKQMLWNHLALMSHYSLDIDWPCEINRDDEKECPMRMAYPTQRMHYRHYGRLLEGFCQQLREMPEGEERTSLARLTAQQIRKDLYYWSNATLSKERIAADLLAMTDGIIDLNGIAVNLNQAIPNGNVARPSATAKKGGGRRRK